MYPSASPHPGPGPAERHGIRAVDLGFGQDGLKMCSPPPPPSQQKKRFHPVRLCHGQNVCGCVLTKQTAAIRYAQCDRDRHRACTCV